MTFRTRKILLGLAGSASLVVLILYTGGFLATGKIAPGWIEAAETEKAPAGREVKAELAELPEYFEAVGTLRPRTETRVESQVAGRVLEVKVNAGDEARRGDLLVVLDARQYQAKLDQARQGLNGARAALQRAESEYARVKRLFAGQAATQQSLEQAREARLRAVARVNQAQKMVEEGEIALGYTRIMAPETGRVAKRYIEPGDLALPGKPLVLLQTGRSLRLEALVREGLIGRVRLGQELEVLVPAIGGRVGGRVEEIVPSADPETRTFLVKVAVPAGADMYPGMFGRLLLPVDKVKAVLIPKEAVVRVGQLETVRLWMDGAWRRIYVTTGRMVGDKVEVLSGLKAGDKVLVPEGKDA